MKIKFSLTTITLVFIFTHMILGDKLTYCLLVPFNTSCENEELNSLLMVGFERKKKMGIWTYILNMLFPLIPILHNIVTSYTQYINDLPPSVQFFPSLDFRVFNCYSICGVIIDSFSSF